VVSASHSWGQGNQAKGIRAFSAWKGGANRL